MILWKLLVLLNVLKNLFSTYLDWVFSWFLNLESWILILIILESWFLKLDWILKLDYSWILILWNLILEAFWLLILWNLLNSWFFGIIKIILEVIASTIHTYSFWVNDKTQEHKRFMAKRTLSKIDIQFIFSQNIKNNM